MSHDTRTLLIAAATDLLDKGGPAAVTLRDVGRLAGISHNAPYKHFVDKEELLAAVASRELERQAKAIASARAPRGPREALRSVIHAYLRRAKMHPQRFRLIFGMWTRDNAELRGAANASRDALIGLVKAAQDMDELPKGEPARLAFLFLAVANGAADLAINSHLSAEGSAHAGPEDLIDDLLHHMKPSTRSRAKH
jgi:AcrR family transcriptional regulator